MGSVGRKRRYETEAIFDFAMLAKYLSELCYPESKELQELARRAKLTFIMAATAEKSDLNTRSIIEDQIRECEECKRWSNDQTCERNGHFTGLANTVPQPIKPKPSAITSAWRPLRSSRNTR